MGRPCIWPRSSNAPLLRSRRPRPHRAERRARRRGGPHDKAVEDAHSHLGPLLPRPEQCPTGGTDGSNPVPSTVESIANLTPSVHWEPDSYPSTLSPLCAARLLG